MDTKNLTEENSIDSVVDVSRDMVQSSVLSTQGVTSLEECLHMSHVATFQDPHSLHVLPTPDTCCQHAHSVTLCIKLPNCDRIKCKFDYRRNRIKDVIYFAHCSMTSGKDVPLNADEVCLSDNNVPMNIYSDHSLTLYEAGLIHNTLLHFSYT